MIFEKYETVKFVELTDSEEPPKTERDSNGFGSSDVQVSLKKCYIIKLWFATISVKNLKRNFLKSSLKKN